MSKERNLTRWALLTVLGLVAPTIGSAQAQSSGGGNTGMLKVAYIDLQTIIRQDPGYAAAESTFRKEMEGMQKGFEKLQQQFDSSMSEYNKQAVVLSPSAKQAKEKQLQTMQQTLQQRAQDFQQQVQKREQELIGPIEDRVRSMLEGIRAERQLDIIFDVSSQASTIVAANKNLDLTPVVLQRIKAAVAK